MATTVKSTPLDLGGTSKNNGFPKDKQAIIPKTIPSPAKVYTSNIGRSRVPSLRWEQPEWDLAECGRIIDTESYARRAFKNKKNLFVKEGYSFVGKQPERVQYIKRRIRQIETASKVPFRILLGQTVASLIRCSNAFWVKVRKTEASGGRIRVDADGKKLNPVAGYFLLPAETVRFKRDEFGRIKKYQQEIFGKVSVEFKPEDVIHFYFNKREGYAVGTPDLVSVKDDIRALRRIEENVELLIYQHLFPLFHYKVGTEKNPAATYSDGSTEVDEVQVKVARMPSDGCWVTPERHEVKALQAGQSPVNVEKVIDHFKQRIITGLGNSSVDMGEGGTANRSTASTMSRNLVDDTKADQKEFADLFQEFVIKELLLESTFPNGTVLDDKNLVELKFAEIDFEARQAKENHAVDIFGKNAITHPEMRMELGLEPFVGDAWPASKDKKTMFVKGNGEWAQTSYGLIERDKIILQAVDEPGTEMAQAAAQAATVKSTGENAVANKNQPENQYGKRSSTKINKDSFALKNAPSRLTSITKLSPPVTVAWDSMQRDISKIIRRKGYSSSEVKFVVDASMSSAKDKLVSMAQRAYRIGLSSTRTDVWDVKIDKIDAKIEDHINKYVIKLKDDLLKSIKRNTIKTKNLRNQDAIIANQVFKALKHRTSMIDNSEIMRAYNYGIASGFRVKNTDKGMKLLSVKNGSTDCSICKGDGEVLFSLDSDAIIYDELPPYHPNCACTIKAGKK